jgi:methionyl aminopeptidase
MQPWNDGVPRRRRLEDGDIVSLDVALMFEGWSGTHAVTVPVGTVSDDAQRLLNVGAQALNLGIESARPGEKWSEVARHIQRYVEGAGYNIVREYVGHGIGRSNFENPKVPHFIDRTTARDDFTLIPGMTLTIEPLVVSGARSVEILSDEWTIVTSDGGWATHFRHTVAAGRISWKF